MTRRGSDLLLCTQVYSWRRNPRICKLRVSGHLLITAWLEVSPLSVIPIKNHPLTNPLHLHHCKIINAYTEGYIGMALAGGAAAIGTLLIAGLIRRAAKKPQ
jgi:hypothetical protein